MNCWKSSLVSKLKSFKIFIKKHVILFVLVAGIEFQHLPYLNESDIADAIKKVGKRAEFREKLFAWRKKKVSNSRFCIQSVVV